MPVTTVTVFHTVTDERGQPIAGVPVRIRLARHRFVRTQQIEILQWGVTTQTNEAGFWSVPLVPNSLTDDPQSFYIVEEGQEGTPVYHVHYIRVPEGVTEVWLGDIVLYDLTSEPSLAPVFANVVQSLRVQGQSLLKGDVVLKAGTNVTLEQDNIEKSITINAIGGGGGGSSHNLLSDTHPDTQPTTVQRGMLIVGRLIAGVVKWAGLASGVAGKFLKSDGTDVVWGDVTWNDVQNKPSAFPPDPHTHTKSQITDLETITTTPTANAVPKADANAKIALGWIPQGHGSGLNADTVDGQHASAFAPATHSHSPADITPQGHGSGLNADMVDGVHAENLRIATIGLTVGDGVNAITTGFKGAIYIPFSGQITEWTILSTDGNPPTTGSIEIDILKSTFANYPTMSSMVGTGTKPNISNSSKGQGTPTGWSTTAVNAGDCIGFNVVSVTALKRITIVLKVVKS